MSAASPAQPQVRRNAAAAPSRSAPPQSHPAQAHPAQPQHASAHDFSKPRGEEAMRLSMSDIPVIPTTLDVEGLQPSLLSRLFDLVAPLDRR